MNVGVVYLLTDTQLAARLIVSLWSLRKWYDGPVTLFTTRPQSHQIGQLAARDRRLRIEHRTTSEAKGKDSHQAAYLTKAAFLAESPYEGTIFLDADTLVVGPLDELLASVRMHLLTATIYGPAITNNARTNKNLIPWKKVLCGKPRFSAAAKLVNRALRQPLPLVNAGVFAIQRNAGLLKAWQRLTWIGRNTPTPEEIALQLLLLTQPHALLGFHFNCLPYFAAAVHDVRIWHFAGSSHLRVPQGRELWLPVYKECARRKAAQLHTWSRIEERSMEEDNPKAPSGPFLPVRRRRTRKSAT
jgi:hypothetical protein